MSANISVQVPNAQLTGLHTALHPPSVAAPSSSGTFTLDTEVLPVRSPL